MKPTQDGKSTEEFNAEMANFKQALKKIKGLMEEQSTFNRELLNSVGEYLLASWEMMKEGAGPEDMKNFRKEKMKKICGEYDKKTKDMKDRINQEANIAAKTQPPSGIQNNDSTCAEKKNNDSSFTDK